MTGETRTFTYCAGTAATRCLTFALAFSLLFGAFVTGPLTAAANTCNTVATHSWANNCLQVEGNANNMVEGIQQVVKAYGILHSYPDCDPGSIDGIFGQSTFTAVECFQRHTGLHVDGQVGSQTWGKMQGELTEFTCSGDWCYYVVHNGQQTALDGFRQWTPSGVWYVFSYISSKFVQMNTSGPD